MDLQHLFLLLWSALMFWVLGQIWFAQVVVYPLFAEVGAADYVGYHRAYSRRIPLPVILPGFASFVVPILLLLFGPSVPFAASIVNVAGGVVSAVVTLGLAIPRHARLERGGRDEAVIQELVLYNWPRTLAMTAQAGATLVMLAAVLGGTGR